MLAQVITDDTADRFLGYFSHPWKHIYAKAAPGKVEWFTAKYFLHPRLLWTRYTDPNWIIGLRFGSETRYAMLDIDAGSQYHPNHNPGRLKELLGALETIGLCRWVAVRSSDSGGIHVYYPLPKAVPTFGLACAIAERLTEAGHKIADGQLEVFPNVKTYNRHKPTDYNGHRLPLQAGGLLLDENFEPHSDSLKTFLDWADSTATNQDLKLLKRAIRSAKIANRVKSQDSRVAQLWKADLESQMDSGFTSSGQTNHLCQVVTVYAIVFLGLSDERAIEWARDKIKAMPGYADHCGHQHNIEQRVRDWVKSTEANDYYRAYCQHPDRTHNFKQTFKVIAGTANKVTQRADAARDRIAQAVSALVKQGQLPTTTKDRIAAIQRVILERYQVKVSLATLYRYKAEWHPKLITGLEKYEELETLEPAPLQEITGFATNEGGVTLDSSPPPQRARELYPLTLVPLPHSRVGDVEATQTYLTQQQEFDREFAKHRQTPEYQAAKAAALAKIRETLRHTTRKRGYTTCVT